MPVENNVASSCCSFWGVSTLKSVFLVFWFTFLVGFLTPFLLLVFFPLDPWRFESRVPFIWPVLMPRHILFLPRHFPQFDNFIYMGTQSQKILHTLSLLRTFRNPLCLSFPFLSSSPIHRLQSAYHNDKVISKPFLRWLSSRV